MPLTPHEVERKLSQHDNDIAAIYAKLTAIERKADQLRTEIDKRFDRVEVRLAQGLAGLEERLDSRTTALEERVAHDLAGLGEHLRRLDDGLSTVDRHLVGIDTHLARMDTTFAEVLNRLPQR